ncbi:MAG: ROK family protein [Actinomycetota bacterium]|nr:ROK family protein [Actinomycetota bacterium]
MDRGPGFGVDVGGSGIKGAPIDLETGELVAERHKVATPQPATPGAVAEAVAEVVSHFGWEGPVGATFPGVITGGVARTAANLDPSWVGTDVAAAFAEATGEPVVVVNDADAAGLAEVRWGAARDHGGLVLVITFGTGIGTALVHQGRVVPNIELGHIELDGVDAETRASAAAREREDLGWAEWAERVQRYLRAVESYLWPDLIVVGGGVSRRAKRWLPLIEIRTPLVAAALQNQAGIAGAALTAGAGTSG